MKSTVRALQTPAVMTFQFFILAPSMPYFNLHELFLKLWPSFFWHDRQVDV